MGTDLKSVPIFFLKSVSKFPEVQGKRFKVKKQYPVKKVFMMATLDYQDRLNPDVGRLPAYSFLNYPGQ
jgi:hypothetical protein